MTKICVISHLCFRHPIVCKDKDGNKVTLELREFYRYVQTNKWLVNNPLSHQPIISAVYNELMKLEIDEDERKKALERERYSNYSAEEFKRFLEVINSSRPQGKPLIPTAGIAAYLNRGIQRIRIPTLLGLVGGCFGYAQNELTRNEMVEKFFYQQGCKEGMRLNAVKLNPVTNYSLPRYEAFMSATTALMFLGIAFDMGERSGRNPGTKKSPLVAIVVFAGISYIASARDNTLKSIYTSAYTRGHTECFHQTHPSQLDPSVVEPFPVAAGFILLVLLAMAAFCMGKLSGYQARLRDNRLYDGINNIDISAEIRDIQPRI